MSFDAENLNLDEAIDKMAETEAGQEILHADDPFSAALGLYAAAVLPSMPPDALRTMKQLIDLELSERGEL